MRPTRIALLVAAPVLVSCALIQLKPRLFRAQTGNNSSNPCCGGEGLREVDFPYYNLSNGFESTLLLVSDAPKSIDFTLAMKSRQGQVLTTSKTIQSNEKLAIDLAPLVTQLGGDPAGDFAEGSVAIYFVGTIMPIAGQMSIRNPTLSLVHESMMVEHDPGRSDIPAVLNSLWWGLGGGRVANVMVSNTSVSAQSARVYLDFQGRRHELKAPLTFIPYETKVLDITQLLTSLRVEAAQAPEGGITIVQAGGSPALIASGRITDPATGFSSTMDFPSPELERASTLHASGLPIGTPSDDSPFAGAGTFIPHVAVRNLLASPQTVTITIEYPQVATDNDATASTPAALNIVAAQDGKHSPPTSQLALATLTVAAYSTQDIPLAAAVNQYQAPLPFCSVRIQYSGPPGSMQAAVSSVESRGNLVVDSRVQNEGNGWAGSGAHPWHLDEDTESILFLTNESDQPARIGFKVTANSTTYYLTNLRLNPHETRAIDMRKLRDAQQPDFLGNKIPAGATDGSVNWIRLDNLPVMGRLMLIHRGQGMTNNYDCSSCICPASYSPGLNYVYPGSANLLVQGTVGLTFLAAYTTCNTNPMWYAEPASWSSQYPSIAPVNSSGTVTGQRVGTTSITGYYTGTVYIMNPMFYCETSSLPGSASATINVDYGCHDQRDYIIQEYHDYKTSPTSPFYPACANFTRTAHSVYFSFSELNKTGWYIYALVKRPMVAPASGGYGMDRWREAYGGPRNVNSSYRNPTLNYQVGGATASRHVFGDAADLRNESGTVAEWNNMATAAITANKDYLEPVDGPCGLACVHADWRGHDVGIYAQ